jgi:hypothetical protein
MRTDKQLYTLLQTVPSLFTDLTGIPLSPDYILTLRNYFQTAPT